MRVGSQEPIVIENPSIDAPGTRCGEVTKPHTVAPGTGDSERTEDDMANREPLRPSGSATCGITMWFLASAVLTACGNPSAMEVGSTTPSASTSLSNGQPMKPSVTVQVQPTEIQRDMGCNFRGPNPSLSTARAEAQRFIDHFPGVANSWYQYKVDNAFDYFYNQLIPGAVEYSVQLICLEKLDVRNETGRTFSQQQEDLKVVVGHAILRTVWACSLSPRGFDPRIVDHIKHACPQLL